MSSLYCPVILFSLLQQLTSPPTEPRPDNTNSDRKGRLALLQHHDSCIVFTHETESVQLKTTWNAAVHFKNPFPGSSVFQRWTGEGLFHPETPSLPLLGWWASQQSQLNKATGERKREQEELLGRNLSHCRLDDRVREKRRVHGRERKDYGA